MFNDLLDDGKPALCFAAHLGNWELPAVAAAAHGLPSAVVYRMPNNKAVAKEISRIRAPLMGQLIRTRAHAALEMAAALERGEHLGMLVDQHFSRGVDVTFFGRRCKANPTIARLARQFDCPVVGVRVIRLPDRRFRIVGEGPFSCRATRRASGRAGDHADDHRRGRTLGPRAPGPMAVVPSALAVRAAQRIVIAPTRGLPQLRPAPRVARWRTLTTRETASMRSTFLATALVASLIAPALAQTGMPLAPPGRRRIRRPASAYPPPGTPVPSYVPPTTAVPPGANYATGARPGNDIGTGMSLPMGNTASNIDQTDTRSEIAPNLPSPQLGPNASAADYLRAAQMRSRPAGPARRSRRWRRRRRGCWIGRCRRPDQQAERQSGGGADHPGAACAGGG